MDSESHALKLREKEIKALSITDTYKYLVDQIGPRMKYASLADIVQKGLHSISRAPLKPCQRLYIHSKNTFVAGSGSLPDFRKTCSRIT